MDEQINNGRSSWKIGSRSVLSEKSCLWLHSESEMCSGYTTANQFSLIRALTHHSDFFQFLLEFEICKVQPDDHHRIHIRINGINCQKYFRATSRDAKSLNLGLLASCAILIFRANLLGRMHICMIDWSFAWILIIKILGDF